MQNPHRQAVILFAHGARDQRWSQTLDGLRSRVGHSLPDVWVGLAYLELQSPTLVESLDNAVHAGATDIRVVPVFWASGGHISNDLPPLLDSFRSNHPGIRLELLPVLSELPGMLDFIAGIIASQARFR